ncbi:hypothetical protein PR048_019668 [Dryococelus australis]|uniref:Uncharacterized protein n=1 Tax=Dryococelus australis TaxID=614101 RepID=A0ABQ9H437_9NEOP|nr:hypothetical protein PR048_019668 [Dryococelus australis]
MRNELIRDRLVVGLLDKRLPETLQLAVTLTLETAVNKAGQTDRSRAVGHLLKSTWSDVQPSEKAAVFAKRQVILGKFVERGKKNPHLSEIQGPSQSGNELFLASVNGKEISSPWRTEVNVGGQVIQFKIDMGAGVTAIPEQVFGSWYSASNLEIKLVNTQHFGPCSSPLKIQGKITTPITWRGNTVMGLKEPLLGWSAIESLGMLQWVEEVNQLRNKFDPQERYPKLFEGLVLMAVTYTIRQKNDPVLVSFHAPRRAYHWCSGIVIVPKQNELIRLCVDLTALSTNVQTVHTILLAIDDSLAQLRKVKVFSKLNTNSGYWQVPLAEESKPLTTFITPFGRFYFN